jgi:hypothetical protein
MTNELRTPDDYELFIYTLVEHFPIIRRSTVRFVRLGTTLARITGELYFENEVRLTIRQRILYHRLPAIIDGYGYEAWRGEEKLYWYDSQPHPNEAALQSTHPHHKHIPPNIKHHRVPAPEMSFTQPNLPALLREIEELLKTLAQAPASDQA